MNKFAELLDRLAYEPSRNNKLRLIADYLRGTPDPERGFALAALTGALSFQFAKAGVIRALIAERTDPVLFELSYDYVGDLSETVALMWPSPSPRALPAPPPGGGGWGWGVVARLHIQQQPPSSLSLPHKGGGNPRRTFRALHRH
jgi:DNA ligase-1